MAEVRIVVTADDKAGDVLGELQGKLKGVEGSAASASDGFEEFGRRVEGLATTVEHGFSAMTRLDITQITVEQSTDRVAIAQDKLNAAIVKFGPNSQQAAAAAQELSRAHDQLDKAQHRAEISMGLVILQGVTMAARLPGLVIELEAAGAAAGAAGTGLAIFNIAATAGVAAISIVAGIIALKSALGGVGDAAHSAADGIQDLSLAGQEFAAQKRLIDLREEMKKLAEENDALVTQLRNFGEHTSGSERFKQDIEDIGVRYDELGRQVTVTENEIQQIRRAGTTQWAQQERERVIATGNLLREQELSAAAVLSLETQLKSVDLTLDQRGTLTASLKDWRQRFKDAADAIAQAATETGRKASSGLTASLDAIGIRFSSLSQMMQHDLLWTAHAGEGFIASMDAAAVAERNLTAAAMRAHPELLNQVSATRIKGESNEELAKRLGLTVEQEKELEKQGRVTTDGIISQEEAQRRLAKAQEEAAKKDAKLAANTSAQSSRTDFGNAVAVQSFTGPSDLGGKSGPERPGSWFQQYHAAEGMDDTVHSPTLILAGERGSERVQIGPPANRAGGGGGDVQPMNLHFHFNGSVDEAAVRRGAQSALTGLSIQGRRVAARTGF